MPRLTPVVLSNQERHEDRRWVEREVQRLYVAERRRNCTWTEYMELVLLVPACSGCVRNDPWEDLGVPDITPETWREDLGWTLGEEGRARILRELAADPGYAIECRCCCRWLRPWERDEVYAVNWFPGERFGVGMYEPQPPERVDPPVWLSEQIRQLYGRRCFKCGSSQKLTMDHIRPVSDGGKGAFANLQPLCKRCNVAKADMQCEKVRVCSDICFGPYASDASEGLFPTVHYPTS